MATSNMLAVRKLKLHGIKDVRWTVHDHKTQYKGLVKLFERDKKIADVDLKLTLRKNKKEIKHLLKDGGLKRQRLDNCLNGDRQTINNLLAIDNNLRLAYKRLNVSQILDHLFQNNFSKRKMMDLLKYRLQIKSRRLFNLRVEEGDLIMQQTLSLNVKTPLEKQIGMVTGKVQDMILKKEATITVNATYKVLIDLLQKDAIYYNAVLDALSSDSLNQGHCLMEAITLGQLATEHLDDMKLDYESLQSVVKTDRKIRTGDLFEVTTILNETVKDLRTLVRRDSDMNMGFISKIHVTSSYESAMISIGNLETEVKSLQSAVQVSSIDDIFPCLKEQARQTERLRQFLEQSIDNYNIMEQRKNHAELMMVNVKNSNLERESEYELKKAELLKQIQEMKKKYEDTLDQKVRSGAKLVKMRASLQNIESICKIVHSSDPTQELSDFDVLKDDCPDMMRYILNKVSYLTSGKATESMGISLAQVILTPDKFLQYCETIQPVEIVEGITWKEQRDDDTDMIEDSSIPTRFDIKEASRIIYENYLSSVIE